MGTLLDLLTYIPLQNIKNLEGGPLGVIKNLSKKSRAVPKKIKKGDPLASAGFVGYGKNVKKEKADPLETKKISKKSRTLPHKNSKGGTSLVSSGFLGYLEKVKNERGTLCTKFALAPLPDWAP